MLLVLTKINGVRSDSLDPSLMTAVNTKVWQGGSNLKLATVTCAIPTAGLQVPYIRL